MKGILRKWLALLLFGILAYISVIPLAIWGIIVLTCDLMFEKRLPRWDIPQFSDFEAFLTRLIQNTNNLPHDNPPKRQNDLWLLKCFRWVVSKQLRDEIDHVIEDLEEDVEEMRQEERSPRFIFYVVTWHSIRTIAAYILDGALRAFCKIAPLLKLFQTGIK